MGKGPENRKSRRVPSKRPARVKTVDGRMQDIDGETRDVSVRGVFIYLNRKVTAG